MINSPFVVNEKKVSSPCHPDFEKYFKDIQIYLEFVQTGTDENGKAIGSVQPVVKEELIDIDELVNSHADQVGLKNLINRYARTGDASLFNQRNCLPDGDYSSIPDKSPEEIYKDIPDELKAGRTYEEFLQSLTTDQLKTFFALIASKEEKEVTEDVK